MFLGFNQERRIQDDEDYIENGIDDQLAVRPVFYNIPKELENRKERIYLQDYRLLRCKRKDARHHRNAAQRNRNPGEHFFQVTQLHDRHVYRDVENLVHAPHDKKRGAKAEQSHVQAGILIQEFLFPDIDKVHRDNKKHLET